MEIVPQEGITPLGDHPWGITPWGITSLGNHSPWESSPWGISSLGNHPPAESFPWGIIPLGNKKTFPWSPLYNGSYSGYSIDTAICALWAARVHKRARAHICAL